MNVITVDAALHAEPLDRPLRPAFWKQQYFWVLIGAALGVLVGWLSPKAAVDLKVLGDVFIDLVKMTIAPLIFLVVVTGIAQTGELRSVGRIGLKTLVYFEIVTTLCLAIGAVVGTLTNPGAGIARAMPDQAALVGRYADSRIESLSAYVLHMVPKNFIGAFAEGHVLQILVLAVLTGIAMLMMGERASSLRSTFERMSELVFAIVKLVVMLAPLGAFGAMAFTVGKFGLATVGALAALVGVAWATLAAFVFLGLGLLCRLCGVRLFDLFRLLRDELLVVIGTSSSETALPGLMRKLPLAGVPRAVTGLVVPSGYSFNLDGVALTLPLSVLFIAQVYGIELSWDQQISMFLLMLFTSKGAAGVTGGAFAAIAATVVVTRVIPVEGLALLLGVDRFMSFGRSIVNTLGNAVAAIAIARWEGSFDKAAWTSAVAASVNPEGNTI